MPVGELQVVTEKYIIIQKAEIETLESLISDNCGLDIEEEVAETDAHP